MIEEFMAMSHVHLNVDSSLVPINPVLPGNDYTDFAGFKDAEGNVYQLEIVVRKISDGDWPEDLSPEEANAAGIDILGRSSQIRRLPILDAEKYLLEAWGTNQLPKTIYFKEGDMTLRLHPIKASYCGEKIEGDIIVPYHGNFRIIAQLLQQNPQSFTVVVED